MRMIPPRNLREEPVAVEEVMGSGMRDPRVHDHGSLKDNRASIQDPPRDEPEDEISEMMNQRLPSAQQRVIMSGVIANAMMTEGGAHIVVEGGERVVCVFVKGMMIAEMGLSVDVIAHLDPRNPGSVLKVTLARAGGARDEDRS